jgi:hypothetical protein
MPETQKDRLFLYAYPNLQGAKRIVSVSFSKDRQIVYFEAEPVLQDFLHKQLYYAPLSILKTNVRKKFPKMVLVYRQYYVKRADYIELLRKRGFEVKPEDEKCPFSLS